MAASSSANFDYLTLLDAKKSIDINVNLFAVITEIGHPRKSRGSDHYLNLKIMDQSSPPLSAIFFSPDTTIFPKVKSHEDIICLHHVKMKTHKGDYYIQYQKRRSSFALFKGKDGNDTCPYQTSTEYVPMRHGKDLLQQLRSWLLDPSRTATVCCLCRMKNIKVGGDIDLVCKVLYVLELSTDEWMLFAWDGTDAPPVTLTQELDVEGENPLPLHFETIPFKMTVPPVGSILRVVVGKCFKEVVQLQRGDQWIRLCNMTCTTEFGIWRGLLQNTSKIRFLAEVDTNVKLNIRDYEKRIASRVRQPLTCSPQPSSITELDFEDCDDVPYFTLRESLLCPQRSQRFKSIVRVVAAYPWRTHELQLNQGCCQISLTLEDPTSRICAYVKDAVKFFGHCRDEETISSRLKKLLGTQDVTEAEPSNSGRDPPWVWCCIKSYFVDGIDDDPWIDQRYWIDFTILKG